uniref:Saposin B-type domain-containing protein n=1 Tax=Heterorhabditis bacteriophora TaxID=37862 RepID=A0A1I7W805_HETBA
MNKLALPSQIQIDVVSLHYSPPILLNNCRTCESHLIKQLNKANPRIRITLNPTLICEYIVRKLFLQCRRSFKALYTFNSNIRFESDDQTSCSYKLVQVLFEILLALWVLLENLSFPISPVSSFWLLVSAPSLFINHIMCCPHVCILMFNIPGRADGTDRSPDFPFCTPDAFFPLSFLPAILIIHSIFVSLISSLDTLFPLNIRLFINIIISYCNRI